MAFSVQDLQDLLVLLRQHPEWRDAVRREVLSDELLELPDLVRRLAQAQEQLTARVDRLTEVLEQLTARVDRLTEALEQLTARVEGLAADLDRLVVQITQLAQSVASMDGRLGNLEGWRYEQKFNARGRVSEILRRPVAVNLAELDVLLDAREDGRLLPEEWKQLLALDFLFRGRLGRSADAPERFVALEVSQVVDSHDVQRAHDRAAILARFGLETLPAVGGSRLTEHATVLAERLGVRALAGVTADET
jgi:hypothetical protein